MPAVAPVDSAGNPITVGAAVKLLGTVTSINVFSNNYHEITVTLTNPLASYPDVLVGVGGTSFGMTPAAAKVISVPPTVLTLGV